jgi:hypothetical protein
MSGVGSAAQAKGAQANTALRKKTFKCDLSTPVTAHAKPKRARQVFLSHLAAHRGFARIVYSMPCRATH